MSSLFGSLVQSILAAYMRSEAQLIAAGKRSGSLAKPTPQKKELSKGTLVCNTATWSCAN